LHLREVLAQLCVLMGEMTAQPCDLTTLRPDRREPRRIAYRLPRHAVRLGIVDALVVRHIVRDDVRPHVLDGPMRDRTARRDTVRELVGETASPVVPPPAEAFLGAHADHLNVVSVLTHPTR